MSYQKLGQSGDPPFTFKVMVVRADWPGASAREVEEQVTDRIEKKLQEVPHVDILRSYSRPARRWCSSSPNSTPPGDVPDMFYQVRKKIGDIKGQLPATIRGPFFNDEFGDVFGNIYALTGDGFDDAQLKAAAETDARAELLRVPSVAKVDLIGEQEQRIYVELSNSRLATLGLTCRR